MPEPKKFAVIGDPIAHSLSPPVHSAIFRELGVSAEYAAIHVPRGKLAGFAEQIPSLGLTGFNITAPHKQEIIPMLSDIDAEAAICGAVNTVRVMNGTLTGFNTDMDGLLYSIRDQGYECHDSRITILGAGGAASGILLKAVREKAKSASLIARNVENAGALCDRISAIPGETELRAAAFDAKGIYDAVSDCDILISTLPAEAGDVDLSFLKVLPRTALVCDLLYSPPETGLLRLAKSFGLKTLNGLGMLIYQAILADSIFLDLDIDVKAMYRMVSKSIAKESGA